MTMAHAEHTHTHHTKREKKVRTERELGRQTGKLFKCSPNGIEFEWRARFFSFAMLLNRKYSISMISNAPSVHININVKNEMEAKQRNVSNIATCFSRCTVFGFDRNSTLKNHTYLLNRFSNRHPTKGECCNARAHRQNRAQKKNEKTIYISIGNKQIHRWGSYISIYIFVVCVCVSNVEPYEMVLPFCCYTYLFERVIAIQDFVFFSLASHSFHLFHSDIDGPEAPKRRL